MADPYMILCIEDERAVLDALLRDLEPFANAFRIEPAENAADARGVVDSFLARGGHVALVLADHLMPGTSGVDFLVTLNNDERTRPTRKVLVTAQAGLADTVKAINEADLHHYIAKPWTPEALQATVRKQLTDYAIECIPDLLPFMGVLDRGRLLDALNDRPRRPE